MARALPLAYWPKSRVSMRISQTTAVPVSVLTHSGQEQPTASLCPLERRYRASRGSLRD